MSARQFWRLGAAGYVGLIAFASIGWTQDLDSRQQPGLAQKWLSDRRLEFEEYRFQRDSETPVPLSMEAHSLLNWSNAERGTDQGVVFLWTDDGKPQMIACAFEWGGSLKHEFHSLSTDPVTAERLG